MGYHANRKNQNDQEFNNVNNEPAGQSRLGRFASGLSDARNSIKDSGGIKNAAGNMIRGAIDNKVDAIKDKAKDKINEKKDAAKDAIKGKINSKMPDSVKKKRDEAKSKIEAAKNKINAPKNKINQAKEKVDEVKQKINEKTFKTGVRVAADAAAGVGSVAEKLLDTPIGQPAVEKAKAASNPITALKEGTKELVKIILKKQAIQKYVLPVAIGAALCLIIIILFASVFKFGDSQNYAAGGIDSVDEKYSDFYKSIEENANGADKFMIIAVLTAYKDNDEYSDMASLDEAEPVEGEEISDSKMKKYIKKVAAAINESTNGIDEGDYVNDDSGSDFFKWLRSDFVKDYYKEYVSDGNIAKIDEIVKAIYLYYDQIKKEDASGGNSTTISNLCPSGITVTGSGTYDLEEYVAGVVEHENNWYEGDNIESMKAQAVAARTYALYATDKCTKPIGNSTNSQTFSTSPSEKSKQAANETAGIVLTYNGEIFASEYDAFCYGDSDCPDSTCNTSTGCSATYTRIPGDEKHTVTVSERWYNYIVPLAGYGHARGMSQYGAMQMQLDGKKYDEILSFFYDSSVAQSKMSGVILSGETFALGTSGVYAESIFPVNVSVSNLTLTQGYYYNGGDYHGGIDLFCAAGNRESCITIPIIAAHSGTVSYVSRDYCASTQYSNNDTTLERRSDCGGVGLNIKIDDGEYAGYTFQYWHFEELDSNIIEGTKIETGQFLGYMGSTGKSTGWHLHFALIDPSGVKVNQNDVFSNIVNSVGLRSTANGIG